MRTPNGWPLGEVQAGEECDEEGNQSCEEHLVLIYSRGGRRGREGALWREKSVEVY